MTLRLSQLARAQIERIKHVLVARYAQHIDAVQSVDPADVVAGQELMGSPVPADIYRTGTGDVSALLMGTHAVLIHHPTPMITVSRKTETPTEGASRVKSIIRVEHFFRVAEGWSAEHVAHLTEDGRAPVREEIMYLQAQDYAGAQIECVLSHATDRESINEIWEDSASPRRADLPGYVGYAATQYIAYTECITPKALYDTP